MIHFSSADATVSLKGRTALKSVLQHLFDREGRPLRSLQYVFCSDDYLLQINNYFLQHNYYTDIVTFEMADNPLKGVEGEVYISVDRVKENSRDLKVSFRAELLRVIFHGALHLAGYGDKTPGEQEIMRQKEEEYMAQCL